MDCSMPDFPVLRSFLEFVQTHVHWVIDASSHLILCHCLPFLPSIFSSIRVFSIHWLFPSGGQSIGAPASASVLPMNIRGLFALGLTGLIILLYRNSQESSPNHSWKVSVHSCSAFSMVQLSNLYMTTGKTIALTVPTFVGKVILIHCLGLP